MSSHDTDTVDIIVMVLLLVVTMSLVIAMDTTEDTMVAIVVIIEEMYIDIRAIKPLRQERLKTFFASFLC